MREEGYEAMRRRELSEQFERLRADMRCVISGPNTIQKKILSARKQVKLLTELEA